MANTCTNCSRSRVALVVLTSPTGEYQLCVQCMSWPDAPTLAAVKQTQRGARKPRQGAH